MSEEPLVYESGAKRSEKLPMYRLIPASFLKHVAKTFAEGNAKYEGGNLVSCNWRRGNLAFQLDCLDHLTAHVANVNQFIVDVGVHPVVSFNENALLEELAHAAVNIAFLIEFVEQFGMVNAIQAEGVKAHDAALQDKSTGG